MVHTQLCTKITMVMAMAAMAGHAHAQDFSNTLGDPGFSGSYVASLTAHDDGTGESLYAAGSFGIIGGGGSEIGRWDGSSWQSVGGGLQGGYTNSIKSFQGSLIAAGYFNTAGSVAGTAKLARWDGSTWHSMNAQSEIFLNSFWDMEVYDDGATGEQLYIAGNYGDLGGDTSLDHIAKWDGTTYSGVGGTIGGAVPLIVLDLHQANLGSGNHLFAGGRFLTMGGISALNVAQWDGASWSAMDGGVSKTSGFAQVLHMTNWDDGSGMALYVGGRFNLAANQPVSLNVAKWDGNAWTSMGDGLDGDVQELVVFDDGSGETLFALGNFNNSGAVVADGVAKWNGTSWEGVTTSVDGSIFGGIVYDTGEGESLIIGGGFSNVNGVASNRVVALMQSGCPADMTGDGMLDFFDVAEFLEVYAAGGLAADFTGDGVLDFFDVAEFLELFGAGCP